MLQLTDTQLGMLAIDATRIPVGARGKCLQQLDPPTSVAPRASSVGASGSATAGRSLPKGQHLLLVGRIAVRLNETEGPAGQPLSIAPRHVSHLGGDDLRASAWHGSVST
jgi:hypothetical protein